MGDAPAFNLLGRQFRPNDKGFDGASGQPRRDDPVEFEAEDNEADPFGLSSTSTAAAYKAAARPALAGVVASGVVGVGD